jgi:hypothetical protein
MEKRQQWIIVVIVILAVLAAGSFVYRQFATVPTSRSDDFGAASQEKTGASDAGSADAIPEGDITLDDVAKGIGDDLLTEERVTESEVAAEKESATAGAKALNEYENAYEENNL